MYSLPSWEICKIWNKTLILLCKAYTEAAGDDTFNGIAAEDNGYLETAFNPFIGNGNAGDGKVITTLNYFETYR